MQQKYIALCTHESYATIAIFELPSVSTTFFKVFDGILGLGFDDLAMNGVPAMMLGIGNSWALERERIGKLRGIHSYPTNRSAKASLDELTPAEEASIWSLGFWMMYLWVDNSLHFGWEGRILQLRFVGYTYIYISIYIYIHSYIHMYILVRICSTSNGRVTSGGYLPLTNG